MAAIDATVLTPCEFASVVEELKVNGDEHLLASMQTNEFTEWLNAAYKKVGNDVYVMENPTEQDTSCDDLSQFPLADMPFGRPAWFKFDISNLNQQGFPKDVEINKPEAMKLWKYWSVNNDETVVAAMRGFVLSSGTCSLDLDIPTFARHPKIMIRECRKTLEGLSEPNKHTLALYEMLETYQGTLATKPMDETTSDIDCFFSNFAAKKAVIDNYHRYGVVGDEMESHALEEAITDVLGKYQAYKKAHFKQLSIFQPRINATKAGLLKYLSSADVDYSVACRGHIFLLNQTSIDLKIPPHEKHENMGFRPVYQDVPDLVLRIEEQDGWLQTQILPRTYGVY